MDANGYEGPHSTRVYAYPAVGGRGGKEETRQVKWKDGPKRGLEPSSREIRTKFAWKGSKR